MEGLQKLLNDFSSWYWWVSVVVFGLVINLASSYMKGPLDRWIASRSKAAAERREKVEAKRNAELAAELSFLTSDGRLLQLSIAREMRWRLYSLMMMLLAVILMTMTVAGKRPLGEPGASPVAVFTAICAIGAISGSMWAFDIARRLRYLHGSLERVLTGRVID